MRLETERLLLRETEKDDFFELCKILQDEEVMNAWGHAFSDEEVTEWIEKNMERYHDFGFGIESVILKETGEMIGQSGIIEMDLNEAEIEFDDGYEGTLSDFIGENRKKAIEIAYIIKRSHWHQGYATEIAKACRDYVWNVLKSDTVFTTIQETNLPSIQVAKRIGMRRCGMVMKIYQGRDLPHVLFSACYNGG